MQRALTLHQTTIGKKVIMALSGVIIVGFTIVHFLGNLNLYLGPEAMDGYAEKLQSLPPLVWGTRLALLFAFGAHITSAFSLWVRNVKARGSRYKKRKDLATDYAARTMYWSGPILLLFVVYHLLHFTILPAHPGEVYRNVVEGFQQPLIAGVYVAGNLALGFHISPEGARSQEFRRRIAGVVFDQVRMDIGVSLQIRLHPVVTGPLVSLPVVL